MDKLRKRFDWFLLAIWVGLLLFGVISIFSASSTMIGDDFQVKNYYLKQIIFILFSGAVVFSMIRMPYPIIDLLIIPGFSLTIILLIVVLFMPAINGSRRWIPIGSFGLQPSELAKLLTIMLTAKLISKPHLTDFQILFRGFGITIIPIFFILLEPDLGTTLVFWVSLFSMLSISQLPFFYLVIIISPLISMLTSFFLPLYILLLLTYIFYLFKSRLSNVIIGFAIVINLFFAAITPVAWNSLKPYQQNRILTFIDPARDPLGAGYQIIQAKIAIGSGGVFGKGYLEGTQKNLKFLPERHTDFIFSVVGEELGFAGCFLLILMLFIFLSRLAYQGIKLQVYERKIASIGIVSYLSFQIFVNIAMNMGAMPTTGIPLPFISYGGSNLLINSMAVGMVLKFLYERTFIK